MAIAGEQSLSEAIGSQNTRTTIHGSLQFSRLQSRKLGKCVLDKPEDHSSNPYLSSVHP